MPTIDTISTTAFVSAPFGTTPWGVGNNTHTENRRHFSTKLSRRPHRWSATSGSTTTAQHVKEVERYLSQIAKADRPPYLDALVHVLLSARDTETAAPSARQNMHPFFIPIVRNTATNRTTGLLRWPTPPEEFPIPVVSCGRDDPCLTLLSGSAKSHVTRALASADFSGKEERRDDIRASSSLALAYQNGDTEKSGLGLERFLTVSAGGFPDVYEGLVRFHLAKGDEASALITCERAACAHPGWGRAHAFHAKILQELGREMESRDAARFCLQMPLWTIGNADTVRDMGTMAGYQDAESLGKIYRQLFEDERQNEVAEGKPAEQVALDRAAWLLDVYVADKQAVGQGWEEVREKLAELYEKAGLEDVATFVRY